MIQDQSPPTSQTPLFDYGSTARATRSAAAKAAAPQQPNRRDQVVEYVRNRGEEGATRHEIAEAKGWPLSSVCAPVLRLLVDQVLVEDGRRRPTQYGCHAAVLVLGREG